MVQPIKVGGVAGHKDVLGWRRAIKQLVHIADMHIAVIHDLQGWAGQLGLKHGREDQQRQQWQQGAPAEWRSLIFASPIMDSKSQRERSQRQQQRKPKQRLPLRDIDRHQQRQDVAEANE